MKLASRKKALTPPPPPLTHTHTHTHTVVCSTDRFKAVVLVLVFVALWFILRGDLYYALPCFHFVRAFFSPFSIAITSFGEQRASLGAFPDHCLLFLFSEALPFTFQKIA